MMQVQPPPFPRHHSPSFDISWWCAGSCGVWYAGRRRAGDAVGALVILRGMAKAGVAPGEHSLASTMEAFALAGDVDRVLSLVEVGISIESISLSFRVFFFGPQLHYFALRCCSMAAGSCGWMTAVMAIVLARVHLYACLFLCAGCHGGNPVPSPHHPDYPPTETETGFERRQHE